MGLLGLEHRLKRTFETQGDYGILEQYLERSLLWQAADGGGTMRKIAYPQNRAVPSWSWMAYTGPISYMDIPFSETTWSEDTFVNPFKSGSLRYSKRRDEGKHAPELVALAKNLEIGGIELHRRLVIDEPCGLDELTPLRGVLIGKGKSVAREDDRIHYVLLVKPVPGEAKDVYERVGVGSLLACHISSDTGQLVRVR